MESVTATDLPLLYLYILGPDWVEAIAGWRYPCPTVAREESGKLEEIMAAPPYWVRGSHVDLTEKDFTF